MELNHFFKISSVLSILFIIYGIICNYIYFNEFGINITEYIDVGEAALLFVPFLKGILLVFVIFLMMYFLLKATIFNKNAEYYNHPANVSFRKESTRLSIVLFILLPIYFAIHFVFSLKYSFLFIPLIILMLYGPFFIQWAIKKIEARNTVGISELVGDSIIILLIFSTLVVLTSYRKIFRTIKKKDNKEYVINFKSGQTLVGDSSTYYLGRTKKYVFIYFSKHEKTKIFDVGSIDHVEISR